MSTGLHGTFVISWSQTEVNGHGAAPMEGLAPGSTWCWQGQTVRLDGPDSVLRLGPSEGAADQRRRAARMVRRLVGDAVAPSMSSLSTEDAGVHPLADRTFDVTDGRRSFTVTVIDPETGAVPLLMFVDDIPPRGRDLWVVTPLAAPRSGNAAYGRGVICFTPGTRITTPQGQRRVETLRCGDTVQTKDSGTQRILWVGGRRLSGARLFAMPALRPVRIRPGALGIERPDDTLLVSPDHRMLIRGPAARALFNTPEVLVAARDLVGWRGVSVDDGLHEVSYIHVMLSRHEVLFANGVETESFHPAQADLDTLGAQDRGRLLAVTPLAVNRPESFGGMARRSLSRSEAAILMHAA